MFVGWVGAVDICSVKLEATVMCLLVFLVSDIIGVTFLLWGGDAVHWTWQSVHQAFGSCFWDFLGLLFLCTKLLVFVSGISWAWQSLDQAFGFCFWDFRGMYLHLCFWSFG